ncbi:MAG: hypothetical protein A3B41_01615 [Candidatus Levybacteria bacterium RIFCSPLOWO2_01_FULL_37_26]|nr:MAG: hypothetical protein A3B41_01615 [Candidatus Levybacteria bacterium RIFCSPLOWO2_01_FULL_37_26]
MRIVSLINKNLSKGFTLIELLIVIAVLGVLAAVVLVAIDPVQQLARGRDAGRKSTVGQLGRALQAYYTTQAAYPAVTQWTTAPNILVTAGEIKSFPTNPNYAGAGFTCPPAANNYSGYCYNTGGATPEAVVYARLESSSEVNKCSVPPAPAGATIAWFVFSTAAGRAGIYCNNSATTPPAPGIPSSAMQPSS